MKIGVGSLKKKEEREYDFFKDYEKDLLEIGVRQENDSIVEFSSLSKIVRGFQVKYEKKLIVTDDTVTIEYCVENVGGREFNLSEYCHNFLSIDSENIGETYNLEFPFKIEKALFSGFVDPERLISINGNEISWVGSPEKEFFIGDINGKRVVKPEWILKNHSRKAGIAERGYFDCSKVNLWGKSWVVSPELFYECEVVPGEKKRWKREFSFFEF